MTKYASAEFILGENKLRSQLEKVERETGKRPPQLDSGGNLPEALEHIWFWFLELCASRSESQPLNHAELCAFFELYGIRPSAIEIEALKKVDRAWCLHRANTLKNKGD